MSVKVVALTVVVVGGVHHDFKTEGVGRVDGHSLKIKRPALLTGLGEDE
jgi:hypothetical protein